jgi:hypothetical protein
MAEHERLDEIGASTALSPRRMPGPVEERRGPSMRSITVRLAGHSPRVGRISLTERGRSERTARTLVLMLLWPVACLLGFLIPPHGEPFALALFGGMYMIHRAWTTAYVVHRLEAECPRCGAALQVKRNARMRRGLELPCYSCHFHPSLDLEPRYPVSGDLAGA